MGETLSWWLVVTVMGLVAYPFLFILFPRFPDRGYAFSKPFGILVMGYVFWLLGSAWVLPNTVGGIIWAVLLVGAFSAYLAWRRREEMRRHLEDNWQIIVGIEVLFFLAFVFAAFLRSYVPDIVGTEKPMDFAFLNAATRSEHFPPNDPWLSGESISYYYGGYFLVAMVGKLAVVDTAVGYNLGLAMTAALAAVAAFGLVFNLVALHRGQAKPGREEKPLARLGIPALIGLGGAVLLVVIGNLEGLLEFLAARGIGSDGFWDWVDIKGLAPPPEESTKWYPTEHWWWWRAARIVPASAPETITEFPFFSFLLGDLHPHVMAIPFALLAIAAGIRLLQDDDKLDLAFWSDRIWLLAALAVLVGGLSFLNTWDMPTFFVLLLTAAVARNFLTARAWSWRLLGDSLGFALPLAIVAVLAYVPYHKAFIPAFGFASQADGIDPVDGKATLPQHALIIWGPPAVAVLPFAVQRLLASSGAALRRSRYLLALAPGLLIGLVWFLWVLVKGDAGHAFTERGTAWITDVVLFALLGLLLLALWRELESANDGEARLPVIAALLSGALAVLLIFGPEFFFVRDIFGNRMNTVFKLYYQAWLLLAVSGGFALYYMVVHWLPRLDVHWVWRAAWVAVVALVLAVSLLYPLGGTFSRTQDFDGKRGLDGLAWAREAYAADYETAQWLIDNADAGAVIAETVGSESTGTEYGITGRISGWTGLSTVLAWPGHERQWRGSYEPFEGRQADIDRLYTTVNEAEAAQIIQKYGIDYVYVGSLERQVYPPEGLARFETMLDRAYSDPRFPDAVLYRVAGTTATLAR